MPRTGSQVSRGGSQQLSSIWYLCALIVPFLAYFAARDRVSFIPFNSPASTNPSCKLHHPDTLVFCEDFKVFRIKSDEYSILSCDKARRFYPPSVSKVQPSLPGELYLWKISDPDSIPVQLSDGLPVRFHPLGIDLAILDDDHVRVFVVNRHPRSLGVVIVDVEISTAKSKGMAWAMGPQLRNPNGLTALSKDTVLVTNDHKYTSSPAPELLLGIPVAEIVEINLPTGFPAGGPLSITTAKRISSPNGIAVDTLNGRLWIASMTHGLVEFNYTITDGPPPRTRFSEPKTYPTPFFPDNLSYRESLVMAGHSNLMAIQSTFTNESATAPSWVVQLQKRASNTDTANVRSGLGKNPVWKTLFEDNGSTYGGVTTGTLIENGRKIAVSGLFAKGILICDRP